MDEKDERDGETMVIMMGRQKGNKSVQRVGETRDK